MNKNNHLKKYTPKFLITTKIRPQTFKKTTKHVNNVNNNSLKQKKKNMSNINTTKTKIKINRKNE